MTNDPIEETKKLSYNDRTKELTQESFQLTENRTEDVVVDGKVTEKATLFSTIKHNVHVIYTEEGIRLAYKNTSGQITATEKRIADMKKQQEDFEEMPDDLKEFKEKLERLAKYTAADKAKAEYEMLRANLKDLKKDLALMKDEIGTRLKL